MYHAERNERCKIDEYFELSIDAAEHRAVAQSSCSDKEDKNNGVI